MSKNNLFSDAIAEAKTIRETAFANAKLALEESFAPTLQTMVSTRLNEMEDNLDENVEEETMLENEDTLSLDQLLSSLDALEESEDTTLDENTELEEDAEGDDEVGEITVDELKDIIRDIYAELNGEETETEEPEDETEETEEEEEINLDELLNEIDSATGNLDEGDGFEELSGLLQSALAKKPEFAAQITSFLQDLSNGTDTSMRNEELEEAEKTITELRSTLNEVNLLNSKLLYVNKIFKLTNLTEAQKIQVVNSLDRAETVKESKNIFEVLKESLVDFKKKNTTTAIRENLGRASKPAGVADKGLIVEGADAFVARMQKLAGIK